MELAAGDERKEKTPLRKGRSKRTSEDNIKRTLKIGCKNVDCDEMAQNRDEEPTLVDAVKDLPYTSIKSGIS
jgi:hypothetical protein